MIFLLKTNIFYYLVFVHSANDVKNQYELNRE